MGNVFLNGTTFCINLYRLERRQWFPEDDYDDDPYFRVLLLIYFPYKS